MTCELAQQLAEVVSHLDDFAETLTQVAAAARDAQDTARRAGEGDE